MRLLVAGTQGTGALESIYGTTAEQIARGDLKTAAEVAGAMAKIIPTDEKFERDFAEANVSKAHLARYYLRALERQVKNETEPYFIPNEDETLRITAK